MSRRLIYGLVIAVLLLNLAIGAQIYLKAPAEKLVTDSSAQNLQLFADVLQKIRTQYVDGTNLTYQQLTYAALDGMVQKLDPHSEFLDVQSYQQLQDDTEGQFGGLGLVVVAKDGFVTVVTPMDDTPAAKAGILSGDFISQIDGEQVQGLTLEQAVNKMKGPVETQTKLTILRKGADAPINVSITREIIHVRPVSYRTNGGDIGYIRISSFSEQTGDELKKAIGDIAKQIPSQNVVGYVLDLRNNPGGLLDQAVSVSSEFLARGEVVSTRGRRPEETQRFSAHGGDLTKGKPLVVLINGGSASASEIVAGALHDHKRATLIGTRSFGKGSVQTIIPLGAGHGALALTTARYFTPSGRSIQAQGILPDIEILQDVPDELKGRAEMKGEASMRGHLSAEGTEQTGSQSYVPPVEKDDKALAAAYNLLRGVTVNAGVPAAAAKTTVPN